MSRGSGLARRALAVLGALALTAGLGACGTQSQAKKEKRKPKAQTTAQAFNPNQATPAAPGVAGVQAPAATTAGGPGAASTVANFFAPSSPWNTPVYTAPVDPNSARLIRLASQRTGVIDQPGQKQVRTIVRQADTRLFVNTAKWTTPVFDETNGQPVRIVCRQIVCGPDAGVTSVTIAPDARPDPRYDGWMTVINRRDGVAYDLWRARRVGDVISYQYIKRWDLNGPGFSRPVQDDPTHAVSARGSGLPLFAGLVLPEELKAGAIDHALAISLPGPAQRLYAQPASVTDGLGRSASIPEGARIRLRAGVRLPSVPGGANRRSAQTILTALKRFGAIVVDRSAVPTLYAKRNFAYSTLLAGNEVQGLTLNDFEVVTLPKLLADPPLGRSFVNAPVGATGGGGG